MDNCSGHNFDDRDEVAEALNTSIEFFPGNSTDKLQPCDSFVIQKFKMFWRKYWSQWRVQAIIDAKFKEKGKNWSGKLEHPPRSWYLTTAKKCCDDLNNQKDATGMSWAQKAMVLCGLGVPEDGVWKKEMLKRELQKIIVDHPRYFSGELNPANTADFEEEDEQENAENLTGTGIEVLFGGIFVQMSIGDYLLSLSGSSKQDEHVALVEKVTKRFDNESVSHLELINYLREVMPYPVQLIALPFTETPLEIRLLNAKVMQKSVKEKLEIHDIEVSYIMRSIHWAIERSQNINSINWQPLHPSSPKGSELPSAEMISFGMLGEGTSGQVFYSSDHFELLLINSEMIQNPIKRGNKVASVMHADSLDYRTKCPTMKNMPHLRSTMIQETVAKTGNAVMVLPCVLQPEGSRICGISACFNLLLLCGEPVERILDNGCKNQLSKYQLPLRDRWTKNDWKCASLVFIKEYLRGKESKSTVQSLLTEISEAIKDGNVVIEEIHEWNDSADDDDENEDGSQQQKNKRKKTLSSTSQKSSKKPKKPAQKRKKSVQSQAKSSKISKLVQSQINFNASSEQQDESED
jgi:hypothetical protein